MLELYINARRKAPDLRLSTVFFDVTYTYETKNISHTRHFHRYSQIYHEASYRAVHIATWLL